jgi:hypothetical protein
LARVRRIVAAVLRFSRRHEKNRPEGRFFSTVQLAAYWLAPEAAAAADAATAASDAAAAADEAAESLAAAAPEAAAAAEAAAAGAEAADVSLAAGAAVSLLLLHAARATVANRDATRRDFFMITSFYG